MSLETNLHDGFTRVATSVKSVRTLLNGNAADLAALTTTNKTNLVAALNSLHAELQTVAGGAAGINDAQTSTTTTWSSTKIAGEVSTAINALVAGAPAALDTLLELANALGEADADLTAVLASLEKRVRFDAAQTLTGPEQTQARANIGAGTSNLALGTTASTAKAGNYTPPAATESAAGIIEIATAAEVTTGTDTTRAVTPARLAAALTAYPTKVDVGNTNADFVATFEAGLV